MPGKVLRIFICSAEGLPMQEFHWIRAIAGEGLEGDRYALKTGAFSHSHRETIRQVSFIAMETIEEANRELEIPFLPQETRRNIVTIGVPLNDLIGKEFSFGNVRFRSVELCDPCERPSKLASKKGFAERFRGRGGLRAEILNTGFLMVGDEFRLIG